MSLPSSAAPPPVPAGASVRELALAASACRACDLWEHATQAVFGEGSAEARVVLIGEQPGDVEDRRGRPFVGPAGRLLDEALLEAGIDRATTYVTNAVKHFKWVPRGKLRLHQTPHAGEVAACRPWLDAELDRIRPEITVAMGATAAKALLGPSVRVTRQRGQWLQWGRPGRITVTVHPSSVLRTDDAERKAAMQAFVADLRVVAEALEQR
ncbi:MAG TPA: UdgX family uracil-DNA binding protein [Acidimicrobiales bacterium]